MAIYTGVADANGDFNIPFSTNYTGGQKVTVTAEKDSATKSIELYAPSEVAGGGAIQFSGSLVDFPLAIGDVTLGDGITGIIQHSALRRHDDTSARSIGHYATGLTIVGDVTRINQYAFADWRNAKFLNLPATLSYINAWSFENWRMADFLVLPEGVETIADSAFRYWQAATYLDIPSTILSIGNTSFGNWLACTEVTCRAITPPTISSSTFQNLNASCVFKVPAASVAAYQAAPNWSAFAARIQAI
ncbi:MULTISPECIES: leucine-rich repeat protein [unclassified Acinetobacter]|uniref:leucine-rich repeat protein n=1 Tax=unclassified Acinetobacter TaxID=196816 RepID=UPI0015D3095A|nr:MULTISPECIES: leucine-rich repeat protein [unclassified Acinetobacter]